MPSHRAARNAAWSSSKAPVIRNFGPANRPICSLAMGMQLRCSTFMSGGVTITAKSSRPWISLATRSRAVATSRWSGGAFSSANSWLTNSFINAWAIKGPMPKRTVCGLSFCRAFRISSACFRSEPIFRPCSASLIPASVGVTPCLPRTISGRPTCASSKLTFLDNVGCDTDRKSAAAESEPESRIIWS